tara:strand:- start:92 stop:415 length:324 start_codon:yes stop_codon:yes gene_type:complete
MIDPQILNIKDIIKLLLESIMLKITLRINVLVKNVAAVPLTATAVNKSLVFKKINAKPNTENSNITNLPLNIVLVKSPRSKTINLDELDKVESRVDIDETIKSKKTM